ncbi:glycosyltransferase family 2 protein [Streptomyces sp. C8S0]|uniref:glycosyltransferase family 2 protein n=1 Tax=Streptomyces sp. C8S0 TaxID=2585716 RepID=UPI001D04374E|nr:glycosyltransferase family 2 protein [Streptomyces sp. C8S0]
MTFIPPTLVAVVGPVEPALLAAWTAHYRQLGIERFLLAFHFPDHVPNAQRHELLAASYALGIVPTQVSTGPWHEHTNTLLRDGLREKAGPGWHLIADADEFQTYPAPLADVIGQAEDAGRKVAGGLMLDRVAADGSLAPGARAPGWSGPSPRRAPHPLATPGRPAQDRPRTLLGDRGLRQPPRLRPQAGPGHARVCAPLQVALGRPGRPTPTRRAVLLRHLGRAHASRPQRGVSPAGAHRPALRPHRRRRPRLAFRHVTLDRLPDGWAAEAAMITIGWRPPAPQNQPGSTISSPSP